MNFIRMREILANALEQSGEVDKVNPLGNVVYATVNDVEFELVIKTTRPERSRPPIDNDIC
jgi:hypothetical protein